MLNLHIHHLAPVYALNINVSRTQQMAKPKRVKDVVTGAWSTEMSGSFAMSTSKRTLTSNALYAYQNPSNPTTAYLGNDKNSNGYIDRDEVFGEFRITASVASTQDYPFPASGSFTAKTKTGQFTLLTGSDSYGIGKIYSPSSFF